ARIDLPGLGSGAPLHLHLDLHEFRPSPLSPQPMTILLNGRELARFTPGVDLAGYDFDLPATAVNLRGDVVLELRSDTFVPAETMPGRSDTRPLGLFVDRVQIEYGPGIIVPPILVWAWLVVSVLAAYGVVRLLGGSKRAAVVVGLALLAAEVAAVVVARPWTAYNSPWLAGTLLVVFLVTLRVKGADADRARRIPTSNLQPPTSNLQSPISNLDLLKVALKVILPVFLTWRIALVLAPIVGSSVAGVPECCPQVDPVPVASISQAAFGHWYRWDAIWYGSIAQDGYQYFGTREASNVAFFPLFPLVNGLAMRLAGLPVEVAGPLLSSLLALAACVALYRLAYRETGEPATVERSVVYLLAFPAAYYLAIGYSEALYLLCVLAAFLWAREGRWGLAGAAAFLAGLARLHGALLIFPLGYEYLRQRDFKWRNIRADAVAVLAAPLGVLAFMAYLGLQFGRPFAYFEIQALFFKGIRAEAFPTFPTTTLANYLGGLLDGVPTTEGVIVVGATILLLVLTLEVWVRLPRVYGVYMLSVALFSLIGGDLISMPRFVVPMFPAFIALALIGRRPWVDRAILIVSLMLQGVLALMFANGYWIA
ncbi:MAG TPA: mannosyltransferase family protein, partial [Anaerolineae bacterium]|nr:mannosyltransferase family protein [Anaerolineae bacterium]